MDNLDPIQSNTESSAAAAPKSSRVTWYIVAVLIVLVIAGLLYYFVFATKDPQAAARKEAATLTAAVGKLIVLPKGEEAIIATVEDPARFADQPYFQNAQKGDKVLIFNAAKKAYLYSPSRNIVVDVAPLSPGKPSLTPKK